jgi:hypothetical protein
MVRQEYKTPDLVLTRQQASSSSIVKIQSRNCKIEMKNTWRYDLPLTKEVCMRERERERERLINDNFALMKEACKRRGEAELWRTYSCS